MAKRTKKGRRRHDAAFKNIYAFRLMAGDLMEIVLSQALFETLDFGTLERLPAEWFGPRLERRVGDGLWRVRRHGGGSLILPVEYQRRPDRPMPLRVNTYVSLLLEDLAPDGRLPMVQPVVLHHGRRPWRAPTDFAGISASGASDRPSLKLVCEPLKTYRRRMSAEAQWKARLQPTSAASTDLPSCLMN